MAGRARPPRHNSHRQPRIIRARCGIAARMVVNDHQAGRARCETRGHEHVRHRDWCAVARSTGEHMPGEQAMLGGETRNGEDLDGLIGDQRRQDAAACVGLSATPWARPRRVRRCRATDDRRRRVPARGDRVWMRMARTIRSTVISFQRVRGSGSGVRAAARRRWPPSRGGVGEFGVRRRRARQSKSRGRSREILRSPAVSQEQRDREQPRVLAGGQAGHATDEHVEVVADMKFFEQGVQQRRDHARPPRLRRRHECH